MSAPRVVHVSQPVEAGVARVAISLLQDQAEAGWSVSLLSPKGWLADRARELRVPWTAWPATRSPGSSVPGEARALGRLFAEAAPDLVHLHSSKAGLAGRLALRGRRPTVFQPHAWSFDAVGGLQGRAALQWERAAARWTDLQVCCSVEEQQQGRAAHVAGASQVVPNGVDLTRHRPADRNAARLRLGVDPSLPVAVLVGRLGCQKGQDVAVAAWPAVRSAVPGATLLLVGDGPDRGALEAAAGEGVQLLGHRDDVADLLAAADLALLPSRWEGLALALLEAMALGRAVVATEVGGTRSTLITGDLPTAGEVVPVADALALAATVSRLLADPAACLALGTAGRARVERDHDLRHTSRRMREAYAAVLATPA